MNKNMNVHIYAAIISIIFGVVSYLEGSLVGPYGCTLGFLANLELLINKYEDKE